MSLNSDNKPHAGSQVKPISTAVEISFTIVESDGQPLTKTYTAGPDGMPQKVKDAGLTAGKARRVVLRGAASDMARQLADKLSGLSQHEALIMAPPPAGRAEWPLVRRADLEANPGAIARTQAHFQASAGPALLVLDFDGKTYPRSILDKLKALPDKLTGALASACPALADAASVARPSVSVGILHKATGKRTPSSSGQHRYYIAAEGQDCCAFAKRLSDRLMLAGWVWGEVSKSGVVLYRTLIDAAASEPARLVYEARAILADVALEHVAGARSPAVRKGGLLDTRALPDLTEEEKERLSTIKQKIADGLKAECEQARKAWLAERGKELVKRGVKPELAEQVLSRAATSHVLSGDFLIELDDGTTVSVADILADPKTYHRKTCADPLEPDYHGGTNLAVIHTDGVPNIYSQAHGGISYPLRHDASVFFTAAEAWFTAAEGADADSEWPEPVDVFGDGDPSALMDVPAGTLPAVIDRYARDVAERMGAPVAFVALGAVIAASAAVGGKLRIQPKANDSGWTVPPFLWGLLVESPGGKKSPVIDAVTKPLTQVDSRWAAADVPKRQAWEIANRKRKKDAPQEPRPRLRRAVVDSFTVEGLRDVLVDNSRGVLVAADEITGLLGGLDQYKAGGGSDRADLLKLADGAPRTIDRVGRSFRADCWGASVLGGVQPKKLAEIAKSLDPDGLLQRFLPLVGDDVRRDGVDRMPDEGALRDYTATLEGLAGVGSYADVFGDAVVTLSPGAQDVRRRFDRRIDALLGVPQVSDAWRGHLSKWAGWFGRLLLVFHAVEHFKEHGRGLANRAVSAETAERTWRFASFLLAHSMRFYETIIGAGAAGEAARAAAGVILMLGKSTVTRRDIYEKRREWRPDGSPHELQVAMRVLANNGWCIPAETKDGAPTSWRINPSVFSQFKERAAAEAERVRREYARVMAAVEERRAINRAASAACGHTPSAVVGDFQ